MLDAGALVLEMSNEEFAREWLQRRREDCEACAFFEGDTIVYVRRDNDQRVFLFSGSPYVENMSNCLLYLDEVHTRGSDFVLPLETTALLSLGKGMSRDKFVQACMRLRQLGRGQKLSFVAAPDVDRQIKKISVGDQHEYGERKMVMKILHWTVRNLASYLCDMVPYFAGTAATEIKRANAFQTFYYGSEKDSKNLKQLADCCVDDEILKLEDLYSHQRVSSSLIDIANNRLKAFPRTGIIDIVLNRVRNIAPRARRHCGLLDEEQERELEHELDEERQVERPPPATPDKPKISAELKRYLAKKTCHINDGEIKSHLESLGFHPLSACFENTSYDCSLTNQLRQSKVFVSTDFIRTVANVEDTRFYLKRFRWMITLGSPTCPFVLLISNFEAEAIFRKLVRIDESHGFDVIVQSFVPMINRGQVELPSRVLLRELPMELHVFGGSINPTIEILNGMKDVLGLHPSATTDWGELYRKGLIDRDGFVPPDQRRLAPLRTRTPLFSKSPIDLVRCFLSDSRHLGSEFWTSILSTAINADFDYEKQDKK